MKKISDIGSLTQQTSHYIGLSRGRAGADIDKGCSVLSFVSVALSKLACASFDTPAAHRNISFGGQA